MKRAGNLRVQITPGFAYASDWLRTMPPQAIMKRGDEKQTQLPLNAFQNDNN